MDTLHDSRRILVITQFFPPETGAASHRAGAFVSHLAERGHDVTVVTTHPSWPTGELTEPYRRRLWRHVRRPDGVHVISVWSYVTRSFSRRSKLANMLTSALACSVAALWCKRRVDIVYVSSPPITLALPALLASFRYRAKLVVDIRDVYPEVAARIGEWSESSAVYRAVGHVAKALYRRAALVTCVTETCAEAIRARSGVHTNVRLIPNGYDMVTPASEAPFVKGPGEFVASYTGNLGLAIGADVMVRAAYLLRNDSRFKLVLVGDGAERERIVQLIEALQLTNVVVLGALDRQRTFAVQALSDVCVIPLRKGVVDSLPTKMMDALALSRPIIVCAEGEAKRFVEAAHGGVAVPPEDPRALADALMRFARDPRALSEMGRSGRSFVQERYNRASLAEAFCAEVALLC